MKSLINSWVGCMFLTLMVLTSTAGYAAVEDFQLSIRNVTQTASNTLEFDVYLLDTDPAQEFELASCQLGFRLNSSIYSGGILSVAINNTDSGLNPDQRFTSAPDVVSSLPENPGQTLIRLAANSGPPVPPGAGDGTNISNSGDGTLLTHFILTSTVDFAPDSTPELIFCSSLAISPLYPTIVNAYINGIDIQLAVTSGTNAIVDGNPVLNPTPSPFTVTGGGSYCTGGIGLPVGLSGSEDDVNYTLYKDGLAQVPTVVGDGNPIAFGDKLSGTYTVTGTNLFGTTTVGMTGSAVIVETSVPAAPTASVTIQPTCSVPTGTIVITAPLGAFEYSLDGTMWQAGTTFSSVSAGSYTLRVRSTSDHTCQSSLPITVNSAPGSPGTIATTLTQPTCTVSTGTIVVTSPIGATIEYSINGTTWQIGTTFNVVSSGSYSLLARYTTDHTCQSTLGVTIDEQPAIPLPAGAITGPATFTPGATSVVYSVVAITGATGYAWDYTGSGETIHGSGNSITIDFSTSATAGTLSVYGTNSCGNGTASTLYLSPSTKILTLTSVLLEGLYDGGGNMREASNGSVSQYPGIADHITVELHSSASYSTLIHSVPDVELSTSGTASVIIPGEYSGAYYITIRNRNHIETTTAAPVSFITSIISYAFDLPSKVFGGNLKLNDEVLDHYTIYGGDSNSDGVADGLDLIYVENGATLFSSGYVLNDLNGDGIVDALDLILVENNAFNFVMAMLP